MALSISEGKIDISVVIPVRNEADNIMFLARELESAMEQFKEWECIWVDDGSSDGSLDVLRKLASSNRHQRYISNKMPGNPLLRAQGSFRQEPR